jgi:alpha-glucosidase
MTRLPAALAALTLALSASCDTDLTAGGAYYVLESGENVIIGEDGSFAVYAGTEKILQTAPGALPEAHRFEPAVREFAGFYDFQRIEERVSTLTYRGSRHTRRGVTLRYASEGSTVTFFIHAGDTAESTRITVTQSGPRDLNSVALPVHCDADASFLGFGEQYELVNQRGEAFDLWVREQGIGRDGTFFPKGKRHDTYFPMPYYLDARGSGLAVDTHARVAVDLCRTREDVALIDVETPDPYDIILFHGPTPADVIRQLGDVYGRPTPPEDWAWGPWMAIQGGQQVTLEEADALDAAMVPYTAIWAQDWVGRQSLFGDFTDIDYHWNVGAEEYPDLAALTANLHGRGKRFLGYFNPFVLTSFEHHAPMAEQGLLIRREDGTPYDMPFFKGETSLPDLTNEAARTYVAGFMQTAMNDYGMDGWMADFAEYLPVDSVLHNGESGLVEHNRYPEMWQRLNHETARAIRGNDYAIFSRSGWLGSQGTTQIVWLGDQEADDLPEDGLPTVVPAMINLGLSGVPYVTHDIAGYSGGPATKILFQRWTELGAFTPVMRTHEGLRALSNWKWNDDQESLEHFRRFARIHTALVPEISALAEEAAETSMPIVRHMLLAFPDDPHVINLDQQYMLGPTLLVAPIIHVADTSRTVYLPAGTWYHVFTGIEYSGPMTLTVAAPVGTPPVFSLGVDRPDLRAID